MIFFFILKTVYFVFSLESPQWGDSNENTQHTLMLKRIKEILIITPDLALSSTLIGSNYPCLELIIMVPKVFEPLKFDCSAKSQLQQTTFIYFFSMFSRENKTWYFMWILWQAEERIHLKHQAWFSLKDKSKKLKCRLLQFLFDALRVKPYCSHLYDCLQQHLHLKRV